MYLGISYLPSFMIRSRLICVAGVIVYNLKKFFLKKSRKIMHFDVWNFMQTHVQSGLLKKISR